MEKPHPQAFYTGSLTSPRLRPEMTNSVILDIFSYKGFRTCAFRILLKVLSFVVSTLLSNTWIRIANVFVAFFPFRNTACVQVAKR